MAEKTVNGDQEGDATKGVSNHGRLRRWCDRVVLSLLVVSLLANWGLFHLWSTATAGAGPSEEFHSGAESAEATLVVIPINGVIMPPLTDHVLSMIDRAEQDESIRGVLLAIDSPGGLVSDSHQIYHRLEQYREDTGNPVFVAMSRMATSGGLYVAMGAGPQAKVFAEPTTWTGSIGVIIPRYDVSGLAERFGVAAEPLKTGPLKDSLNPFRELSEDERAVWAVILDDAFQRFIGVVAENRESLDRPRVTELATGQIYTASQARAHGLVDEIGYEEDAIVSLKEQLGISEARVVTYRFEQGWLDLLTSAIEVRESRHQLQALLDASVPRALYLSAWGALPPGSLD